MGIETNVSLIVASLDLQLVRLLRAAMQTTPAGTLAGCGVQQTDRFEPRQHIHPEPAIETRPRIHPTPRFEPRPVIHPLRREVPLPQCQSVAPPDAASPTHKTPALPSPMTPWKLLAWKTPVPPRPQIKVTLYRPEIIHKGSLLDFFI